MKHILFYLSIFALVMTDALTLSCSEVTDERDLSGTVTLTTTVTMPQGTKALASDGTKTFAEGDQIAVVYKNKSDETVRAISEGLSGTKIQRNGKYAEFTVTLTDPKDGPVTYIYPAAMADENGSPKLSALATQDGSLSSISSNLDYCTYTGSMSGLTLPKNVTLTNQLAICKFTLLDGASDITGKVTRLTVSDGTNNYIITRAAAAGPIWVAMHAVSSEQTIAITAYEGACIYEKSVTDKTLSAGNIYPVSVSMVLNTLVTPLTFEAKTAGAKVTFTAKAGATLEYSKNGSAWTAYQESIELSAIGEKVSFRGNNTSLATDVAANACSNFAFTGEVYAYGNMMSLLNNSGFAEATSAPDYAFSRIFNNSSLFTHPTKTIQLPATSVGEFSYAYMFANCTNWVIAPALPAMTLSHDCYAYMFSGCKELTTAPALPAMSAPAACYQFMFNGCTGLETAPALPATTLGGSCYMNMFTGCTNLTAAPAVIPAENLSDMCCYMMFSGCTALTTAPALPATTLATSCYANMFWGCENLTSAPTLSAPVLTATCYHEMFKGCKRLNSITCLATDITASQCTYNWLDDVAATGTFTKSSTTTWSSGASGIPSTWTTIPVIPGMFTINNSGKQVFFSPGNLQYIGSAATPYWKFADHQYDYLGKNGQNNSGANIDRDLFGWGTSGFNHGATAYQPWSTYTQNDDYTKYYAYGNASAHLYEQSGQADWGYNAISNGGNKINIGWRTLKDDDSFNEWRYILKNRVTGNTVNNTSDARFTGATINKTALNDGSGVKGVIIFPDNYAGPTTDVTDAIAWGTINAMDSYGTKCTTAGWATLEKAGCVFLPAAGNRIQEGYIIQGAGSYGNYWSSSTAGNSMAYYEYFSSSSMYLRSGDYRQKGYAVRLVRNVE